MLHSGVHKTNPGTKLYSGVHQIQPRYKLPTCPGTKKYARNQCRLFLTGIVRHLLEIVRTQVKSNPGTKLHSWEHKIEPRYKKVGEKPKAPLSHRQSPSFAGVCPR
jgi:hypothetical protein